LFLGGSTGFFYSQQMMEAILPGTHRAFNLSYGGPSATDRAAVSREILRHSHARRYILEVDWSYTVALAEQRMWQSFPIYLYDDKWWNDVRSVNSQNIALSLLLLQGRPLWIESWGQSTDRRAYQQRYALLHSEKSLSDDADMVARRRAVVAAPTKLTCRAMDAIGERLLPFVRELSSRGARVDLIVPPYSWMIYFRAGEPGDPLNRPTLLSDILRMRSCLVEAAGSLPGVNIYAFDDVPDMAGNFSNYFDAGHLYNPIHIRYILHSLAAGEHRLTPENIASKNAQMSANVANFRVAGAQSMGSPQ
jgi:hypothetical protein